MVGVLKGVGEDSERKTGPESGEASGLTTASGARTEFSVPGAASVVGDVAGRMTTRGVAEASGKCERSAVDGVGSVEGLVFWWSSDLLTR
jgi:hypothetical protein